MKYYILSTVTRILLGKLRKYHSKDPQVLVFSRDFIGEEIYAYGRYEKHEIKTIIESFDFDSSNHIALDIGANIGNHTLLFAEHFMDVYCFEPNPLVFDVLRLNTRSKENIHLHNFGLSDHNIKTFLNVPDGNIGGGSVSTEKTNECSEEVTLKIYDDHFNFEISFVKIDVEGHELNSLNGMKESLKKYKPLISFELINSINSDNEIISFLNGLGYTDFYIPYVSKFFLFRNSNSSILNFFNGLLIKRKYKLKKVSNFNKPFYNLIICEHPNSNFKINGLKNSANL
jgi:FkbM family methyltransferase